MPRDSHRMWWAGREADQPRPAFGRRPWFALLRRARSLRLFAFAMGRRVPRDARPPTRRAKLAVTIGGAGPWRVRLAVTSKQRLRGLIPRWRDEGLLLRGTGVHGCFMREPLTVLGLDATGRVVAVKHLAPWRFVRIRRAHWIVEVPATAQAGSVPEGALAVVARLRS